VVDPGRPLSWADARLVIEQVIDELLAAGRDGTLPARLGADQLWVEPSGRVHLLEFPVPTTAPAPPAAADPLDLVRQVTTLLLEGKARSAGGPVAAPLPPHASLITDRLFAAADPFPDPEAVHKALAACHAVPPQATPGMRAAQVGLTAVLAGPGLVLMYLAVLGYPFWTASFAAQQANAGRVVVAGLRDPAVRQRWADGPEAIPQAAPDRVGDAIRRTEVFAGLQHEEVAALKQRLSRPERYLVDRLEEVDATPEMAAELPPSAAKGVLRMTEAAAGRGDIMPTQRRAVLNMIAFVAFVVLAAYVAFAFAFRGGLSYVLAGLALVRRDGRPAGRFVCAARESLLWVPVVAALGAAVGVQVLWPYWGFGRAAAAAGCVGLLGAYVLFAVRFPGRGPHDRVVGTYVVPV
jgi:hypothetical protein